MDYQSNRLTLVTLPEDILHLIARQLHEVGSPADLYSLYRSLVCPAPVQDTSHAIASRIIKPWLYRKVDINFAGAESVGTTQLLRTLFDATSDVRKWNTPLPMTFRILQMVRRLQPLENLHVTIFLGSAENWRQITFFKQAGMKRLSFTLCHTFSPLLQHFDLATDLLLPSTKYGSLLADAMTTASVEKVNANDWFISWVVDDMLQVDEAGVSALNERRTVPIAKDPSMLSSSPNIEQLYLEGFPFGCSELLEELQRYIDFSKLKFLELRNCYDIHALLDYLVDNLNGGVRLRTIRIVGAQKTDVGVETTLGAHRRFFGTYQGFEEIVIDDHPFSPHFISHLGCPKNKLRRLELHFPKFRIPYQHPLVSDPTFASARDAHAVAQIRRQCPNLTDLHIDMQLKETEDQMNVIGALRNQTSIESLSISLPANETVDRAQAERIAGSIHSKPLRRLNILYRPTFFPYITRWDRFGPDEPWPVRTPEELTLMLDQRNATYGLRWTAEYKEHTCTVVDAWALTNSAHRRALKRVSKANNVRYGVPSAERDPSALFQWYKRLYKQAEGLTVDLRNVALLSAKPN
ncbi:MAG: hypothetical protein Q9225_007292 [Loekoesia sp. 1 TL-2023]